jgi:hypothetical protein
MNTNFDLFISLFRFNVPHWFSYGHPVLLMLSCSFPKISVNMEQNILFVCRRLDLHAYLCFSFCTPANLICMDAISPVNLICTGAITAVNLVWFLFH